MFVSTVNAFVLRGARPVFVDVRPDTLNLDERKLPAVVGARTKAVIPVHYSGVGCEMDAILDLCASRGVPVVEDNAHGLFGRYRGRFLGSFGALATQSFHETKNFTCGEGGGLLIGDPRHVERAEILREKGTDRARFFRGQANKYEWMDLVSSYVPSDVLAAFLLAQLDARAQVQARRRAIWERYAERLGDWARANGATLPTIPAHCESSYLIFHLLLPSQVARDALIAHLRDRGILAVFHYLPLHLSPMGRKWGYAQGDFPVTEDASTRLLRLPLYHGLSEAEQGEVIAAVREFAVAR
jgi:dTDP-4-amino-4,6-dideoxygalactose transaminase